MTLATLFTLSVSATNNSDIDRTPDSDKDKAMTLSFTNPTSIDAIFIDLLMETTLEDELSIEEWMYEDTYYAPVDTENTELDMIIEEWMINGKGFTPGEAVEKPLKVENWMLNGTYWQAQ